MGIGASAGGLAAFEAFFSGMPPGVTPGMAFVLVQHLAPDHKSILSELVRRFTRLEVFEVEDGMKVRPNCAYIIPPNRDMAFLDGALQLLEPAQPHGQRLPIDFFFRSLAADQGERAIGIVLAGTGSDGTLGIRAIKGEGGMAMAQRPEGLEFNGMPVSAIGTGLVDFVLPPEQMPAQLLAFAQRTMGRPTWPLATPLPTESALRTLFALLRAQTGHDFSLYKLGTIQRRIERRMAVHHLETFDAYLHLAQERPNEIQALFKDLLISVTSFFRDKEAFEALAGEVLPPLLAGKQAGAEVRVWSAGCCTGEEAYSLAMLCAEAQQALALSFSVKIFATDIDGKAIATARAGIYPATIAADVSPERLARFFVAEPGGTTYRLTRAIRDMVVFSEQDVIRDPPFSRMDLISCRNLLIYLGPELQKKLLPLFHYALNPGGVLFLGTSESVGEFGALFTAADRSQKLYRRKQDIHGAARALPVRYRAPKAEPVRPKPADDVAPPARPTARRLTEEVLLERFAPAGVLVDEHGAVLYLHGRTGQYLEPAQGEGGASNVLKMAREGLHSALAASLRKAARTREPVRVLDLRVKTNGAFTAVDLNVVRVRSAPLSEGPLFVVTLQPAAGVPPRAPGKAAGPRALERIKALTDELAAKDAYLQAALEDQETVNEELKSSNGELQSVNEELQSANEELETSKEELQSVNEELATVNHELQAKVGELSQSNNDMVNLLSGTGVGTIFVSPTLTILRFTPTATQVFNFIPTDVGRPVRDIVSNLVGYDGLVEDVQAVLGSLTPREIEVQTRAGAWFLMRIRPYRTLENVIEGAVITFVDITELRKLRQTERLGVVLRDASDAITLQDIEGRILAWNPAAERLYGWTEAEALAMNVRERVPEDERATALATMQALARQNPLAPPRVRRLTRDGRALEVSLVATLLFNAGGQVYAIATTERPVGPAPEGEHA